DVVSTIKKGIIDPAAFGGDPMSFVYAMSAALLAAAVWLNVATYFKAPVSTTHSIVGGVMGGGIAAGGFAIVSWGTMGKIAASWIISPVLGAIIASIFLLIIKKQIVGKEDMKGAAKKIVPVLVAVMAAAFITYLTIKGLKKIWPLIVDILVFLPETKKPTFLVALSFGAIGGFITYFFVKIRIVKKIESLSNNRADINILFNIPLVFAAILLSFAHGANDVANAVGPLAAVYDALSNSAISAKATIPIWVMVVGGVGISVGLFLFGPRLIKTVGTELTELDQMRSFSIMMAAAITVVIASQLGLPVSSTHIAIGALFGVGFLREYLDRKAFDPTEAKEKYAEYMKKHDKADKKLLAIKDKEKGSLTKADYKEAYDLEVKKEERLKAAETEETFINKMKNRKHIKREDLRKIIAAWIITVPVVASLSAAIYFIIVGVNA
ncbi:MAG: inorganic phosphate transporter, partial [Bacteroidales bacterium]|nr:inorganic phosphate transporter [Bacteroidales bacterium]